jgi:hypothetical protein
MNTDSMRLAQLVNLPRILILLTAIFAVVLLLAGPFVLPRVSSAQSEPPARINTGTPVIPINSPKLPKPAAGKHKAVHAVPTAVAAASQY